MVLFVVRRLALLVVAFFVASILIFLLLRLLPGDLARAIGGVEASEQRIAALRARLGLDRPVWEQYGSWIGGVLRGDFGNSLLNNSTVTGELGKKLTVTAPLLLMSTVLSLASAIPLGIVAAARHRKADGVVLSAASQLGIAIPTFIVGLLLIVFFAVKRQWFPVFGFPNDGWDEPGRAFKSLLLPAITLAFSQGAVLFRFVRSAVLGVLNQDYIRTARAKGLTRTQALWRHGLRNAALPIVAILGVQIASLIAGVVVIERVFTLPGVGQMLVKDIQGRDLEKVQGTLLILATIVLVVGFCVDFLQRIIDPRLRGGS